MIIFRRLRLKALAVLALHLAFLNSVVVASDFDLSLEVKSADQRVRSKYTEEQPSPEKPHPRPMFTSESHALLQISWKATNVGKDAAFKDVLVHCLVVAEKTPGQTLLPDLKDPVQESAITMDFKPGDVATGTFSLTIDKPGAYLVRVETQNMLGQHGHEHYTALDLVAQVDANGADDEFIPPRDNQSTAKFACTARVNRLVFAASPARRSSAPAVAVGLLLGATAISQAEHARIDLRSHRSGKGSQGNCR